MPDKLHPSEKELLDTLAEKSGFFALSDMKYDSRWKSKVSNIPDNAFPLCERQKSFEYLTGRKERFDSVQEIKKQLMKT